MKITKIGFGFTKNLGHYENQKLYLEAELEEWEDASQSLNILRDRVAEELSLPDKYLDLKGKFARQLRASEEAKTKLEEINEKIEQAMAAWENFAEFLVGHGVVWEIVLQREVDREIGVAVQSKVNVYWRSNPVQEICQRDQCEQIVLLANQFRRAHERYCQRDCHAISS